MAENTTTYKAVIETEVQGGEQIDNLGNQAEQSSGKFKSLRTQIRETTIQLQKLADEGQTGTAEFEKLRKQLDDLNDAQEKVNFQAGQFDDQLAALPGPLGAVGNQFRSLNEGLNKFSLGFKVALGAVGLLIGAFATIKESLSRTEEGQAKLNKITEAFTKIMNGLFAIVEPIANAIADLAISLLSSEGAMNALSTAAGVLSATFQTLFSVGKALGGFIVNNLVNAFRTLVDVATGAGKVLKGVFTLDLDLIKEGAAQVADSYAKGVTNFVDNIKSTATNVKDGIVNGIKDGMKQGSEAFKAGSKRLTEEEKKAEEERKKKRAEAAKQRAEEEKKAEEQRKKDILAAQKVEIEAYLSAIDARDKDIYNRGLKLNDDLVALEKGRNAKIIDELKKTGEKIKIEQALQKAGKPVTEENIALEAIKRNAPAALKAQEEFNTSRLAVQEAYRTDVAAINKKYDDEEAKKAEEQKQKDREKAKLAFEEAVMQNENKVTQIEQRYNREIALVNEKEKLKIEAVKFAGSEELKSLELTEEEKKRARELGLTNLEALELKRQEVIRNTNQQISQIESDASLTRQGLQLSRYDEMMAAVDEREKLLLTNTELNEAQKTKITLDAEAERANIRQMKRDDELLGIETELNNVATSYDRRRQLISQKEQELLQQEGLTENQRTAIKQQAAQERQAIDTAELEARAEVQNAYMDLVGNFGSLLQQIAGKNKKVAIAGVVVEQAAAIGKIIQNTAVANAKSVAAFPITAGMPWVAINTAAAALSIASSIAAGAKAIQQIKSSDAGGGASSGGGLPKTSGAMSGGGASAAAAPSVPALERTVIPQIVGTTGTASPGAQIAQTLAMRTEQPLRAYVVSGDITSQQALDRRTNRAATFSGGTNG